MFMEILGLIFVLFFFGLMVFFAVRSRRKPTGPLRDIPAFDKLRSSVRLSVESGKRLHLSLGRGNLISTQSAVAFIGLSALERIARATSVSDRPPVATSGDGGITILSQDTLRTTSRRYRAEYDPMSGQLSGLTPYSYAAGTLSLIHDGDVSANVLLGSFGSEVALINEAGERSGSLTLAGTDDIAAQSVIYASAHEPLIGEETYASGAYLGAGPMHVASLSAQDILRWILAGSIVVGSILKLVGLL
jgi:hypothetical protein